MVPADFDACKEHGHDVGDEYEGGGGTDGRHSDRSIAIHVVHYARHHHEVMRMSTTSSSEMRSEILFPHLCEQASG